MTTRKFVGTRPIMTIRSERDVRRIFASPTGRATFSRSLFILRSFPSIPRASCRYREFTRFGLELGESEFCRRARQMHDYQTS